MMESMISFVVGHGKVFEITLGVVAAFFPTVLPKLRKIVCSYVWSHVKKNPIGFCTLILVIFFLVRYFG
jgi:hypothetical protein